MGARKEARTAKRKNINTLPCGEQKNKKLCASREVYGYCPLNFEFDGVCEVDKRRS